MCWNCGCMMPDDDMGNPDNITTAKLLKASKAGGTRDLKQLWANMTKAYSKKIKGTPKETELTQ